MNYTIELYKNDKLVETRFSPIVIENRGITLTCSNIDRVQLYDDVRIFLNIYYYYSKNGNKITFKQKYNKLNKKVYSYDKKG